MDWSYVLTFISGGLVFQLIDYLIKLAERREQRRKDAEAEKRLAEADRPRPRVDVAVLEPDHPQRKLVLVKILSLGGLPLTINHGDVFIYSSKYEQAVEHRQVSRKEITAIHPIEIPIYVKNGIFFQGIVGLGKATIKLECQFSYGENGQAYTETQYYNYSTHQFESRDYKKQS